MVYGAVLDVDFLLYHSRHFNTMGKAPQAWSSGIQRPFFSAHPEQEVGPPPGTEMSLRSAFPPAQHGPQVMLQVIDVIHEQRSQGHLTPALDPASCPFS